MKRWLLNILACWLVLTKSYAGTCVWEPHAGTTIPVDADISITAYPGDPAPDDGAFCGCDDNDDPTNWALQRNLWVKSGHLRWQ